MNFELSKRLGACLNFLSGLETIADIGTDHALLPCYGILNHKIKQAVAADVGAGPLQSAKKTVDKYDLAKQIDLRLGSGLSVLKPGEVEGIVIAGMGGKLIRTIIEADLEVAKSLKRLVLQANVDASLLREGLMAWNFKISDETIIFEDGKYYEIIVAEPSNETIQYHDNEISFGPSLLKNTKDPVFQAYWNIALHKQELILSRLPKDHHKLETVQQRVKQIQEVLE